MIAARVGILVMSYVIDLVSFDKRLVDHPWSLCNDLVYPSAVPHRLESVIDFVIG